jgi:hypothetical protein
MDNYKLIMIFIFLFLKHDKDAFFLMKNIHGKLLVFGRMHENKILFCFLFLKEEINLNFF